MFSRLTACATCFAVLTTATIAFAASEVHREAPTRRAAASAPLPAYQLPMVQVTGHRSR